MHVCYVCIYVMYVMYRRSEEDWADELMQLDIQT